MALVSAALKDASRSAVENSAGDLLAGFLSAFAAGGQSGE